MGYGLDKQIHNIFDPRPATQEELENYHDRDYIEFLSKSVAIPVQLTGNELTIYFQDCSPKPIVNEANDRQLQLCRRLSNFW